MYTVQEFYQNHGKELGLNLVAGSKGLRRKINKPEAQRPGLSLTGETKRFVTARILIVGRQEIDYVSKLNSETKQLRFRDILSPQTPAVIIARNCKPPKELIALCEADKIPLFRHAGSATKLLSRVTFLLLEEFAPTITLHGTLVEIFGVGVLIQGESSVGKSEAALGLIEKGHRLISDDVVRVKKSENSQLIGSGPEITRHLMEIRGIGIVNIAHLYGAVCVRHSKRIDLVVKLEEWDNQHFYDRVGLDQKFITIIDISVPFHLMPLKPGRDIVLLLETIALNHRLKEMGYNSAREFNTKLLEAISHHPSKSKRRTLSESRP
ncbi:MAG: HPr(Ser) kinase/phosphatase [Chlamydiia bacterium]|nr:HPr(Ser) kinase/phosphatase [Chlamydiia bacterium]